MRNASLQSMSRCSIRPDTSASGMSDFKEADMVEFRISQSAYPSTGSLVPANKVTELIAKTRGIPVSSDARSPARHPDIHSAEDLKHKIDTLRDITEGRPIGIKFAAGHIEKDLDIVVYAEPDYIVVDGFGGGSGAPPSHVGTTLDFPSSTSSLERTDILTSSDIASMSTSSRLEDYARQAISPNV